MARNKTPELDVQLRVRAELVVKQIQIMAGFLVGKIEPCSTRHLGPSTRACQQNYFAGALAVLWWAMI